MSDPEVRKLSWQTRVAHPAWHAKPNAGHLALVALEKSGRLHALVTQNIDGLHQRAGNSPERVIEVHGTMHRYVCWDCRDEGPMQAALDRVRQGEDDPSCLRCGGKGEAQRRLGRRRRGREASEGRWGVREVADRQPGIQRGPGRVRVTVL